jgi:hypothetical protein
MMMMHAHIMPMQQQSTAYMNNNKTMVKPPPPPLPPVLNPCSQVRRTCREVMSTTDSTVTINDTAIPALIQTMNNPRDIKWDEEGWHYTGANIKHDPELCKEYVALYILALDAINFCFWPSHGSTLEYHHLAMALTKLASNNHTPFFFTPTNLATMTVEQMKDALEPLLHPHTLPNLQERCRLWNELGAGLLECHDGKALNLIDASHQNAPRLVHLLLCTFSGFRDATVWEGMYVSFNKRAQICVADLEAALCLDLEGMEELTTFADYRVPQLLRHVGILRYNEELSEMVDSRMELNVKEEVSIRAATVVAVEQLVETYNTQGGNEKMTAVQMDWHLWQVGERLNEQGEMKPHHRVNTIFY